MLTQAASLLTIGFWEHQALLAWQQGRAPIVAGAVALCRVAGGAAAALGRAASGGGGAGAVRGLDTGARGADGHAAHAGRAAAGARGRGAGGRAWRWISAGRAAGLAGFVLAVAAGWWLAGAPRSDAEAGLVLPHMGCLALAVLLALRLLRAPRSKWSASAAALALWGGLAATGAPGGVDGVRARAAGGEPRAGGRPARDADRSPADGGRAGRSGGAGGADAGAARAGRPVALRPRRAGAAAGDLGAAAAGGTPACSRRAGGRLGRRGGGGRGGLGRRPAWLVR